MKRTVTLIGTLIALSLITIPCLASAKEKIVKKDLLNSPQSDEAWYDNLTERFVGLRSHDIYVGRYLVSVRKNLEISTPVSETLRTRLLFGNPEPGLLPDTERYNLGLGFTTRMRGGLAIDTSMSFSFSGSPESTFWITLHPVRF